MDKYSISNSILINKCLFYLYIQLSINKNLIHSIPFGYPLSQRKLLERSQSRQMINSKEHVNGSAILCVAHNWLVNRSIGINSFIQRGKVMIEKEGTYMFCLCIYKFVSYFFCYVYSATI